MSSAESRNAEVHLASEASEEFQQLLAGMMADSIRVTPEDVIAIWKPFKMVPGLSRTTLFLEKGDQDAGYRHIVYKHGTDLLEFDVGSPFRAINDYIRGERFAYNDNSADAGILSLNWGDHGLQMFVYCGLGSNGFVVTAPPIGSKSFETFLKK